MEIPKAWARGLEEREEFESKLLSQKNLFERLYDIIDEMEQTNDKDSRKKSHYEKPAWSEFQADAIGYSRALSEIKLLLKFTKEQ